MLFKLDCINPKQTKKLTLTNISQYPILVRILENKVYSFFPTFALLKINEQKIFQILPKELDRDLQDIKVEAIIYDESRLETFSVSPFWKEKGNKSLQKQTSSIPSNSSVGKSNSFASYEVLPSMNQTFQEQKNARNSIHENSIKIDNQQFKHSGTQDSEQFNSKQKYSSQSSLQGFHPPKIEDDSKVLQGSNQLQIRNSQPNFIQSKSAINSQQNEVTSPKIHLPQGFNQFLDQIDSSASPFQIQSPSQEPSQNPSQKLIINDNGNENISLSETTSIQRQDRTSSLLQQSKSAQNDLPKFRVSQTLIGNPRSVIESTQQFEKIKEKENQIQKQITELKLYKVTLEKELEQLEFRALFNSKNKNSSYNYNIYIWHMLLTCVLCLIIGSALRKIILI